MTISKYSLPLLRIYSYKVIIVLKGAVHSALPSTTGAPDIGNTRKIPLMDRFPNDIFFHARHVGNVRRNIMRDTLCLRGRFAPRTAYSRIVGCGRSFAFISRKTMPASREELIGMFENITATSRCYKVAQFVQPSNKYYPSASYSPSRILHQFDKKGKKGKRLKKKLNISDVIAFERERGGGTGYVSGRESNSYRYKGGSEKKTATGLRSMGKIQGNID